MSSSFLTSKGVLIGAALFLAVSVGGCGKQGGASQSAAEPKEAEPAAQAPLTRAFVRITALENQHPLQVDVRRLQNAERRIAGLAPGVRTGPGLQDPYELPAVGTQIDRRTALQVADALQQRRLRERGLLAKRTAAQLGAFLGGISYRQERLLDQRRAELQAIGQSEQDQLARLIREGASEEVRNQVLDRSAKKLNSQIDVGILSKQLRPDLEGVAVPGPVVDEEKLRIGIAKLEADASATYIPERARFIVALRKARTDLQALQAEIDQIIAAGNKSANERIQAAQNARLAEIELELEALRDDAETLFLFRNQRRALASALAAEADVAARTASFQGLTGESRDGAGAIRFASLFGTAAGATGSASRALDLRQALNRVVTQRARLQRFIRVDVQDAVQDAAETHRVDLVFAPDAGRRDMTAEFAAWLRGNSSGPKRGVGGG